MRHLRPDVVLPAMQDLMHQKMYLMATASTWTPEASRAWKAFCDRFGYKWTEQPDLGIQAPEHKEFLGEWCLQWAMANNIDLEPVDPTLKSVKNLIPQTIEVTDNKNGGTKTVNTERMFDKMIKTESFKADIARAIAAEEEAEKEAEKENNKEETETDEDAALIAELAALEAEEAAEKAKTNFEPEVVKKEVIANEASADKPITTPVKNVVKENQKPSGNMDFLQTRGNK